MTHVVTVIQSSLTTSTTVDYQTSTTPPPLSVFTPCYVLLELYTGAVTGILGVLTQPGYTHYSKESYDQIDGHLTPIRGLHFSYSDKQDHSPSTELFQAESYAIV